MRASALALFVLCTASSAVAEQGVLVVHVEDINGRPIGGVRLRAGNSSISAPTQASPKRGKPSGVADTYGQARIQLAPGTKPGDSVLLELIAPDNLVFLSPFDRRVNAHSFDDAPTSFVKVVLVDRRDRALLENRDVVKSLINEINLKNAAPNPMPASVPVDPLVEVANRFGRTPEEIDQAIREWSKKPADEDEKAQAALYVKDYVTAEKELVESLRRAEEQQLEARSKVAEQAFFLGYSLEKQGKHREAAAAYEKALANHDEIFIAMAYAGALARSDQLDAAGRVIDTTLAKLRPLAESDLRTYGGFLMLLLQYQYGLEEMLERPDAAKKTKIEQLTATVRYLEATCGCEPILLQSARLTVDLASIEGLPDEEKFAEDILKRFWNGVLATYTPLAKQDAFYNRYLALAHAKLGDMADDDWETAERHYRQARQLYQQAASHLKPKKAQAEQFPITDPDPRVARSTALYLIGHVEYSLNRPGGMAHMHEAIAESRELARQIPAFEADLADSLEALALFHQLEEQWCESEDAAQEALSIYRRLPELDQERRQKMAETYVLLFEISRNVGRMGSDACRLLTEARDAAKDDIMLTIRVKSSMMDAIDDGRCTREQLLTSN